MYRSVGNATGHNRVPSVHCTEASGLEPDIALRNSSWDFRELEDTEQLAARHDANSIAPPGGAVGALQEGTVCWTAQGNWETNAGV